MTTLLSERDLPTELTPQQAAESAYSRELAEDASKSQRSLPCLIECDKDLAPFLFMNLRCVYLDGRPRENEPQQQVGMPAPSSRSKTLELDSEIADRV
jgi:cell division protease FtsH